LAKKKVSRKELLKGPDEFLTFSSKAINYFNTHIRELQYIGLAVAVIIIGYLGIYSYFRYVNKHGQEAYNKAFYTFQQSLRVDSNPSELKKSEELFAAIIDNYGMSKAARLALPQIGYIKFLEKRYDEAIQFYRKFLDEISGDKEYEALTNIALADCYEAKGDLKMAIDILVPILANRDDPFRETAMFSLARLYRLYNKLDKEKEILERFLKDYGSSPFAPMARARL